MDLRTLPADIKRRMATVPFPVNWETAKKALANCYQVDEAKAYKDKADGIACYAKQIKDDTLLRIARDIQSRALRKIHELLDEHYKGKRPNAIRDSTGVSVVSQRMARHLAAIPEDKFEKILKEESLSPGNIIAKYNPLPPSKRKQKEMEMEAREEAENEEEEEEEEDSQQVETRLEEERQAVIKQSFVDFYLFIQNNDANRTARDAPRKSHIWFRKVSKKMLIWIAEFEKQLPPEK